MVVGGAMSIIGLIERFFSYKASGNTAIFTGGGNYYKILRELAVTKIQARRDLAHFFLLFNKTEILPTLPY